MNHSHDQFTVLPFSLSVDSWVFTIGMAVVAAFHRRLRVDLHPCLDDWLVKGQSKAQVVSNSL